MSQSIRGPMVASLCALVTLSSLVATQASAQSGPGGPGRGREVCGSPMTGAAPDIMSYDSATGTQVFVNSGRGTGTDVSAYNAQSGSAAQFRRRSEPSGSGVLMLGRRFQPAGLWR